MVAISLAADRVAVQRWAKQHGLTAQLALSTGPTLTTLGVEEAPSVVFVDRGRIVGRASGPVSERALLRRTSEVLGR